MNIAQVSAVSPSGDQSAVYFLTFNQAVDVWLLHWKGQKQQEIATHIGTNQLRVDAVLNERQHIGSRERARQIFRD